MFLKNIMDILLGPEEVVLGAGGKVDTAAITLDDLEDDAEDAPPEPKKEPKKEPKEDKDTPPKEDEDEEIVIPDDEEIEDEDKDKEPLEIDDEVVTPPKRKEILAAYPDLFKKFPYIEHAIFRARAYSDVFPTVEEAKEAFEKSEALDGFEGDLLKGDTERILKSVKEQDEKSFHRLVDNYLTTLAKVDEKAYYHVLGNVYKNAVAAMVTEGNKKGKEALKAAAEILHQFVFGNSDFEPPTNLSKDNPKEEDDETKREKEEFYKERFEVARNDVSNRVQNTLKSWIDTNIDPKDMLTAYVKKNATRDALEEIYGIIQKDEQFMKIMNRLWADAHKNKYSSTVVDKIRSTYISKAKTVLPTVIKKVRNEALKGLGKRAVEKDDSEEEETSVRSSRSREDNEDRPRNRNNGKTPRDQARNIPIEKSTADFLMED